MKHILALLLFFINVTMATAQEPIVETNETIEIIVTANTIIIEPDFNGSDLYIAGVIGNAEPSARLRNQYDVIVVLEGPRQTITIRKKRRRLGMWVNADSITFERVPQYYSLATTRELRDITQMKTYERLHLGFDKIYMRANSDDEQMQAYFRQALMDEKKRQHLYSENIGAVSFGKASLFTARFSLPANVPVGHYTVRAYLFKSGKYHRDATTELQVVKAHLAYLVFREAQAHSFLYGVFCVLTAIATGFAGRFIFRKD